MARQYTIPIPANESGLTWTPELFNNDDTSAGEPTTSAFIADGANYVWNGTVDDDFDGYIQFTSNNSRVFNSIIYDDESSDVVDPDPTPVTGAYNTYQDMVNERGVENIRSWSQKGLDGDTDFNAVNSAIRGARDEINLKLRIKFTWPLVAKDGTAITQTTLDELESISEPIASFRCYAGRGLDADANNVDPMKQARDDAIAKLDWLIANPDGIDLQVRTLWASPRAEVVGSDFHIANPFERNRWHQGECW